MNGIKEMNERRFNGFKQFCVENKDKIQYIFKDKACRRELKDLITKAKKYQETLEQSDDLYSDYTQFCKTMTLAISLQDGVFEQIIEFYNSCKWYEEESNKKGDKNGIRGELKSTGKEWLKNLN